MTLRRWSGVLAGLSVLAAAGVAQAAEPNSAPRLVVVISVDQFSTNLFNEWRPRFQGGLKTLSREGLVYANGWQSHSATETCPGHSTLLTGKHPYKTGIAANDWVDPVTGKTVYCVADPGVTLADPIKGGNGPVSPKQLQASTLGDWLKATSPQSRVYGIAGKDRGAITMAGHKADGVFWWQDDFGFTTWVEPGQTPEARLADVAGLNARLKAHYAANPAAWTYTDDRCRALEADYTSGGAAWRSRLPPAGKFRFDYSPFLDEVTTEGALQLIADKKLGAGPATDVLAVSYSATDRIGHMWGTQGPEMCDQLYRLDASIGRLLDALKTVPGGAVVVLTADHGGADFTERLNAQGYPEVRGLDFTILKRLNAGLKAQFKLDADPVSFDSSGLYIVGKDRIRLPQPLRGKVAKAAVALLAKEPDVEAAWTLEEVLAGPPPPRGKPPEAFTLLERATLSAAPGRSPDVVVALKPGVFPLAGRPGGPISTHGSPWDYDRRVPILVWWPGAPSQERFLSIETTDIAPTLAHLIGVAAPADIDGRCLDLGGFAVSACPMPAVAPPPPAEPAKPGFRWPWEKKPSP